MILHTPLNFSSILTVKTEIHFRMIGFVGAFNQYRILNLLLSKFQIKHLDNQ